MVKLLLIFLQGLNIIKAKIVTNKAMTTTSENNCLITV